MTKSEEQDTKSLSPSAIANPVPKMFEPVRIPFLRLNYQRLSNPFVYDCFSQVFIWLPTDYPKVFNHYKDRKPFTDFVLLAACTYPYASRELLLLITKSIIWGFTIDDMVLEQFESEQEANDYVNRFMQLLVAENLDDATQFCQFCGMLLELYTELKSYMSDEQRTRFFDYTLMYIQGTAEETRFKQERQYAHFSVNQYLKLRRKSVGSDLYQLLCEITVQSDLSSLLNASDANSERNMEALANMFSCINDLYSYNKECQQANMPTNLVKLIQWRQPELTAEQAVQQAIQVFYREKDAFDHSSVQMLNHYDSSTTLSLQQKNAHLDKVNLSGYVQALSVWVYGIVVFHYNCFRYSGQSP